MHAVVVRVTINDFETGRQFLTEQVVPRAKGAPGFVAGYWTRSDDSTNGLSMIVFESEDAARTVAQMIESQVTQDEGVTFESTEVREVVASA
jgi:heme-degrading monooxygenase HmoA